MASGNDHNGGRYLYCIVKSSKETDFGHVGIGDRLVYVVPFNEMGVVVHRCEARFYKTRDREKVAEWFLAHQYVIDLATKEFGTVIPLTFNTIFTGDDEAVKKWLNGHYHQIKSLLENIEGKEEYEVQIFLENGFVRKMMEEDEEIQGLRKEIENKTEGAAYLFKMQQEKRLALIQSHAKNLYDHICQFVDDVKLEPMNRRVSEKWQDKLMILNLSCLVQRDKAQNLENMLRVVYGRESFAVRFTGPWPPYSFVGEIGNQKAR